MKLLSRVRPSVTPWTFQAPLSMGFSRQEHWSGVPLPSPVSDDRGCEKKDWKIQGDNRKRSIYNFLKNKILWLTCHLYKNNINIIEKMLILKFYLLRDWKLTSYGTLFSVVQILIIFYGLLRKANECIYKCCFLYFISFSFSFKNVIIAAI